MTRKKPTFPKEISWLAQEFIQHTKSTAWFVVVTAIGVAFIAFFALQRDFLTALLFTLMLIFVILFARQKPRELTIKVNARGISIGQSHIPYQQIKSFWLVYQPPDIKTLNIETTAYLNRSLTIQLERQNPIIVRNYLNRFIIEDLEKSEDLSSQIARTLKF